MSLIGRSKFPHASRLIATVSVFLGLAAGNAFPQTETIMVSYRGKLVEAMPGEVIIRFTRSMTSTERLQTVASLGLRERLFLESPPLGAYTIMTGETVEAVIEAALRVSEIENAGPSRVAVALSCNPVCGGAPTACPVPDDILYPQQTGHLGWTDIDRAWNDPAIYGSKSDPGITIWVIDSGADPRHPDLVDKYLRDPSGKPVGFCEPDLPDNWEFDDHSGHGTAVSGVAAASADDRSTYTLPLVQVCDATGGSGVLKDVMLTVRRELAGGIVGTVIYAIGGRSSGTILHGEVEAFSGDTCTWSAGLAAMPTPRAQLAVAELGGSLFAVGGTTDFVDPVGTAEVYDPANDAWSPAASPMPTPRRALGAAALGGRVYAIGGNDGNGPTAVVESYDPATGSWATAPSLNVAREGLAAVALNGVLYAIGGDDGTGPVGTVEVWDGTATCWTVSATPLPTPRSWLVAATDGSTIFAIGGEDGAGLPVGADERFDPASSTWTKLNLAWPASRALGAGWRDAGGTGHWAVIGGKGDGGMAGMAWSARIVPVRIFDTEVFSGANACLGLKTATGAGEAEPVLPARRPRDPAAARVLHRRASGRGDPDVPLL